MHTYGLPSQGHQEKNVKEDGKKRTGGEQSKRRGTAWNLRHGRGQSNRPWTEIYGEDLSAALNSSRGNGIKVRKGFKYFTFKDEYNDNHHHFHFLCIRYILYFPFDNMFPSSRLRLQLVM